MLQNSQKLYVSNFSNADGDYGTDVNKQKAIVAARNSEYESAKLAFDNLLDKLSKISMSNRDYLSIKSLFDVSKRDKGIKYDILLSEQKKLANIEGFSNIPSYRMALKKAESETRKANYDYLKAHKKVIDIQSKIANGQNLQSDYIEAKNIENTLYDVYTKIKEQSDELEKYYTEIVGSSVTTQSSLNVPSPSQSKSIEQIEKPSSMPQKKDIIPTSDTIDTDKKEIKINTKSHALEIYGLSAIGLSGGYVIGYHIADHFKKNHLLFGVIGAVVLGLGAYYATTKFVYPTEEKSGFVKGARKCWCATSHGMEQCPCGGNSDKN